MGCPFKVGDRIKPTQGFAPNATVTAVSEHSYTYEYDEPYWMHPRLGIKELGGEDFFEMYPEFPRWELADDDNSKKTEPPFLFCVSG